MKPPAIGVKRSTMSDIPDRKPFPKCCEAADKVGGIWWEDQSHGFALNEHRVGWTMMKWASIPMRSYALMNVSHCPHCGTKLPEKPE